MGKMKGSGVHDRAVLVLMPTRMHDEIAFHAGNRNVSKSEYIRLAILTQNAIDSGMSEEQVREWREKRRALVKRMKLEQKQEKEKVDKPL